MGAHTDMMYIHVFILVSDYVCMSIYIYTILKNIYLACLLIMMMIFYSSIIMIKP
jgi:hypothetical protein